MSIRKILGEIRRSFRKTINKWPVEKQAAKAMEFYKQFQGYAFDWNNPVMFTEKLAWYKIFYDRPDFPDVVDKYLFKDYIKNKIGGGFTIPLIGVWENVKDLRSSWDSLPKEFVLKSTLQSDGKHIKVIKDKTKENLNAICDEVRQWLKPYNTLINSLCRAYHRATPRVIAEKYESQIEGQLFDYKVFCFDGKPYCFYVATDHFPGQLSKISFYDLDWNRLDVRYGEHPNCDVQKPAHFSKILELSKKLSEGFPFVRVDFFDTGDKLYVAELTLYPGGNRTPYHPQSFNKQLGDMFILPERNVK
ncbi:MAG: hypothetical protein J5706_08000 [Elusimicrobiales bacterium]|nr:hypothetical protein [Elusimicrobiales bacterium]